tara:strand:- start:837 stop:1214 length:378 start_codon:yes stop_codon:yes gene_type:complete
MSSNRLKYDDCTINNQNKMDDNQLKWIIDDTRFTHQDNCFVESGLMSGNIVGKNNMIDRIDLEGKLFGIDDKTNDCSDKEKIKYDGHNVQTCNNFFDVNNLNNNNNELNNNEKKGGDLIEGYCGN